MARLWEAAEISIIGYSIPDFDFPAQLAFRLAACLHRDDALIRVFDANPSPIVQKLKRLGHSKVEGIPGLWENSFI